MLILSTPFLKIKQQSSSWPSYCKSEEEKNNYISEFLQHDRVQLEPTVVMKNPGLRSLAKLMLNGFWGKFGQKLPKQSSVICEPKELFDLLTNPSIEVNGIQEINQDVVIDNWSFIDECIDPLPTTNVIIASFL